MQPLFIPSTFGPLFGLLFRPVNAAKWPVIIHIPAFAEEMNKARRMVNLQAQAFAEQGYAVLILDLFGTGDSAGDFGAASWDIWQNNIADTIEWLKQQGAQTITLWGLRTGALLAMDYASRNPIDHLLCWQPVLNGDVFINQFLRLQVAAAMMDSTAPPIKTAELKRQLLAGQAIEVAGYQLNPELVKSLLALRAEQLNLQTVAETAIFELAASADQPVSLGNAQFLLSLQQACCTASLIQVVGDFFWASQEVTVAPDLLKVSVDKVNQWL